MPEEIMKDVPEILINGIWQGIWMCLKFGWFPLLCIVVLLVVARILNDKIDRRNYLRKKQIEELEWENRMEKFLDKKERRDRMKK